jgi:ubiquinone/menaquinone biosynthesis C-methylase UbiE
MRAESIGDAQREYQETRRRHWDQVAQRLATWNGWGKYYHRRLAEIYQFLIPPNQKILEVGSGDGGLLATLNPAVGVGIDFSPEMIARARELHPGLEFIQSDAHDISLTEAYDYVIMSDLLNDVWDVQQVFEQVRPLCHQQTRIIINSYSRLWEFPLNLAQRIGAAKPNLIQNWLTPDDIRELLYLTGFEGIKTWPEIALPIGIPIVAGFINRFIGKFWPFKHLAVTNFVVARPVNEKHLAEEPASVSVVIPARNEAGNISNIFSRIPEMGSGTELVFVEGHSQDNTYQTIEQAIKQHPDRKAQLLRQTGKGKGDAVRLGFEKATGDILMILDADLTVPPEDLPRFYDALVSGKGDLINGVRLVYPMEAEAMRFLNLLGNKFFSIAFSWLLNQPIKDTLCGTKALYKQQYERIAANRSYFGDFDPFGDFDLIFGAAKQNYKIIDLPIRYRSRTYGTTNISRWKHGWLLLQMVVFAARRIKFV